MAKLKIKDIKNMDAAGRIKQIEELKFELVKAKVNASKAGTSRARDIKKIIARILTLNNQENKKGVGKK